VFLVDLVLGKKEFLESTNHLGRVLAKRKIHLVYGGESLGLMWSVSTATFQWGSQALGIILKSFSQREHH
jgi:predicted Rossmann-fold nucleotide-binding protein